MLTRESTPFAGKWKTERASFQRGIMDTFSDPKVERIVCMTASQVGKTEILNNICGYFTHHDPCPTLVLQPTLEMARAWSVDRLAPMIAGIVATETNANVVKEIIEGSIRETLVDLRSTLIRGGFTEDTDEASAEIDSIAMG